MSFPFTVERYLGRRVVGSGGSVDGSPAVTSTVRRRRVGGRSGIGGVMPGGDLGGAGCAWEELIMEVAASLRNSQSIQA